MEGESEYPRRDPEHVIQVRIQVQRFAGCNCEGESWDGAFGKRARKQLQKESGKLEGTEVSQQVSSTAIP